MGVLGAIDKSVTIENYAFMGNYLKRITYGFPTLYFLSPNPT